MNNIVSKLEIFAIVATMSVLGFVGCVGVLLNTTTNARVERIEGSPVAMAATPQSVHSAPYFTKGVYVNYSEDATNPEMTYFYVFEDETIGHTDDGTVGIGCPFKATQEDGKVLMKFGGEDEPAEALIITSVEDGEIHAYFEGTENRPMIFKLMPDLDPTSFDAETYVNAK